MIVSFIDGRVRLRSLTLRSEKVLEEMRGRLAVFAGVEKIETNARTGSVLVHYDPAAISRERLNMAVALLESRRPVPASGPVRGSLMPNTLALRKIENRLLCGGALMALAGAVSKVRPLHAAGGILFFLLAGRHLYVRRKVL